MAKYEDYVKKQDSIEQEIGEAAEASEVRKSEAEELPERFRGKSASEIARSYAELEALYSRQANDLGALRKTVDSLIAVNSNASEPARPESKPISMDELYENADGAIRRVVSEEASSRIEKLENELKQSRSEAALNAFKVKHPTYEEDVRDPAFLDWVKSSNFRVRLAVAADNGDLDAADELFGLYNDAKASRKNQESATERRSRVKAVSLETSSPTQPDLIERISRVELMEKRLAAKRGDLSADRWLRANSAKILQAYAEGNVVD